MRRTFSMLRQVSLGTYEIEAGEDRKYKGPCIILQPRDKGSIRQPSLKLSEVLRRNARLLCAQRMDGCSLHRSHGLSRLLVRSKRIEMKPTLEALLTVYFFSMPDEDHVRYEQSTPTDLGDLQTVLLLTSPWCNYWCNIPMMGTFSSLEYSSVLLVARTLLTRIS